MPLKVVRLFTTLDIAVISVLVGIVTGLGADISAYHSTDGLVAPEYI